jgi:hypothetical protein
VISEAGGKILGMAMAYGVSALGLLLAYLNYRRRIVKAERAMSAAAWAVVAITALAVIFGAWTVARLAPPAPSGRAGAELAASVLSPPAAAPASARAPEAREWSWPGLLIPAAIFLFATWVTAALFRHFSVRR